MKNQRIKKEKGIGLLGAKFRGESNHCMSTRNRSRTINRIHWPVCERN